jgi:urea transport system substrate-binding protein
MKLHLSKWLGACAALTIAFNAMAADTIKVGILHSLSGTMAISETSLRDMLLFAFDEINAAGGVKIGDKSYMIEPVIVDGASNWPLFAEKAKQLLEEDKVAVVFGCWTSVSRKSVLPVFEKDKKHLLHRLGRQPASHASRGLPAGTRQEEVLFDRN